jgi:MFS family permease
MVKDLGLSGGQVGWTITAYSLVFGSLLLLGGRAADLLGRRRMFMTGLGVFTAASVASAVAGTAGAFFAAARARVSARRCCRRPRCRSSPRPSRAHSARRRSGLGRGRRRRRGHRRPARRHAHRAGRLARHLLRQPARRIAIAAAARRRSPRMHGAPEWRGLDVRGAIVATASLAAIVYALSQAADAGWTSRRRSASASAAWRASPRSGLGEPHATSRC